MRRLILALCVAATPAAAAPCCDPASPFRAGEALPATHATCATLPGWLYYHPTTWPGARLPHVWVERDGARVSTLDLCGHGHFTLLTGIGGEAWHGAARATAAAYGIELPCLTIGPAGSDAMDIFGDWFRAAEIEEDGAILVRPDHHVAWRAPSTRATATEDLTAVMGRILGRA